MVNGFSCVFIESWIHLGSLESTEEALKLLSCWAWSISLSTKCDISHAICSTLYSLLFSIFLLHYPFLTTGTLIYTVLIDLQCNASFIEFFELLVFEFIDFIWIYLFYYLNFSKCMSVYILWNKYLQNDSS